MGGRAVSWALALAIALNVYLGLGVLGVLPAAWRLPLHSYWVGAVVNAFFITTAWVLGRWFPPENRDLRGLTVWTPAPEAGDQGAGPAGGPLSR